MRKNQIKFSLLFSFLAIIFTVNQAFKVPNKTSKSVESVKITNQNSSLPSNLVSVICIDPLNVKWIGTDKGLARLYDDTWIVYTDSSYFKSNKINDIDFERSAIADKLWVASDSGLTAAIINTFGIDNAKVYHPGDSDSSNILDWKMLQVAVDNFQNKWVVTPKGISVYNGISWHSLLSSADAQGTVFNLSDITITDAKLHEGAGLMLFSTKEKGILRNSFDEVDGITGASTYGSPWAAVETNEFYTIDTKGDIQWYGTDIGAYEHPEIETKSDWNLFAISQGLVSNKIIALHIDNQNNIWMGTENGLSIYLADKRWFKYTETEGLVNNHINHITSDMQGNVWVATNGGVEWFNEIPGIEVFQVSINPNTAENPEVRVFPNPAKSYLTVYFDSKKYEDVIIELYNLKGEKVFSSLNSVSVVNKNSLTLNLLNQQKIIPGLYVVNIKGQSNNHSSKIIIEK